MKTKQFFIGSLFLMVMVAVITAVFITPFTHAAPTQNIIVNTTADVIFNNGQCSLREAVIAANTNTPSGNLAGECLAGSDTETDIITLAENATYTIATVGINENESLTGDFDILDNSANVDMQFVVVNNGDATIDANGLDRVLHIIDATVELNKITLSSGVSVTGNGGNLYNEGGIVTINGGTIMNGFANFGGGIYNLNNTLADGHVTLNDTMLTLNAASDGGGIASVGNNLVSKPVLTLNNAIIRGNSAAGGNGGGIYAQKGNVTITGGAVTLNESKAGAGIYVDDTTLTINHGLIESNTSSSSGGGIYLHEFEAIDNFTLLNSDVNGNAATSYGGGLYSSSILTATVTIQNSSFFDNEALSGGVIHSSNVAINGGTFESNLANSDGGAVYATYKSKISNAVFLQNNAVNGGALRAQEVEFTNIHVENNEATARGGGAVLLLGVNSSIVSSVFISNTAGTDGGGITFYPFLSTNTIDISQTVVAANHAIGDGGGIWTEGNDINLSNSTISSNRADGNGAGLYIEASTAVTATNVTIAFNTPGLDIYKVGELTLQNSIIHTPDTPNCALLTDIISLGNNLTDDASCDGLTQPTDEINVDVLLAPLADYGGNTLTHDLLDGSPAIDTGNGTACAASPVNNVDQRSTPRPIGTDCDKGAIEHGSVIFLPAILK